MNRRAKRTIAMLAALAMLAVPALSCCFALLGLGQVAYAAVLPSAAPSHGDMMPGGAMDDHCAETGEAQPPGQDISGEECGDCADCSAVTVTAPAFLAGGYGKPAQTDYAVLAATAHDRPEFLPALLRATGPPQGPPVILPTPVHLHTTLRL